MLDGWMDKGAVHAHKGILLRFRKEHIWVSSNEVSEPGPYYTEWSKSERERQLPYINTHIWNLERQYQWSNRQGSKGDTYEGQTLDSAGEGKGGMVWENTTEASTLLHVK